MKMQINGHVFEVRGEGVQAQLMRMINAASYTNEPDLGEINWGTGAGVDIDMKEGGEYREVFDNPDEPAVSARIGFGWDGESDLFFVNDITFESLY